LTFAEFLGDDFAPEVFRAWNTAYGKIAEAMTGAAAESALPSSWGASV
jgi:hemoglobin-like flavoprotein